MSNIGKIIGNDYKTLMPDLTDDANIQDALEMYHYGQANYDPNTPTVANSIEGHLGDLQDQIDDLFLRPGGGGEVKATEPAETPTGQPIPDGYIWVDKDDISLTYAGFPTVLYSPTQPTGLGIADIGTIWVNSNSSVDVLSLTDYARVSPVITQTITNTILTSPTINSPTINSPTINSPTITTPTITTLITTSASTSYTLLLTDASRILEFSSNSAITITVPPESTTNFPVGSSIAIVQTGNGQITVSAGLGVTLNGTPGFKTRTQWSLVSLIKRGTNLWILAGDSAA